MWINVCTIRCVNASCITLTFENNQNSSRSLDAGGFSMFFQQSLNAYGLCILNLLYTWIYITYAFIKYFHRSFLRKQYKCIRSINSCIMFCFTVKYISNFKTLGDQNNLKLAKSCHRKNVITPLKMYFKHQNSRRLCLFVLVFEKPIFNRVLTFF